MEQLPHQQLAHLFTEHHELKKTAVSSSYKCEHELLIFPHHTTFVKE